MRASQAMLSANTLADQVQELFETDYDLEDEYHSILGGGFFFLSLVSGDTLILPSREMGSVCLFLNLWCNP